MASLDGIEIPMHVRFVIDDRTRAALTALGWTPPPEPRPETPGDPDCPNPEVHSVNGGPFRYCSCGWAEATT